MKLRLALNSCCCPTYNRTRVGSTHMGDTPGARRNLAVATRHKLMCNLLEHRGLRDDALTKRQLSLSRRVAVQTAILHKKA